jgi:D-alanine transaminase
MLIDILQTYGDIPFAERVVTRDQVASADEIWLTSSTKEVVPVTQLDGNKVGSGQPGPYWQKAQRLFDRYRFNI